MKESRTRSVLMQLLCIVCAILVLAPILYALSVSFMQAGDVLTKDHNLLPPKATLENYVKAVTTTPILRYMLNSLIVALISSVSRVFIGAAAAYAFSFYEFKGKNVLFALALATIMVPSDVLIVQNYVTISRLHLISTYAGICSIFLISANNILMMRQHFLSYSKSVQEAARLDGASDLGFFFKILIPTSKPILFTIFLSSFVSVWNQYVWPMIVTNKTEMRTIQVGITMLKDRESTVFGPVMAGAVIALVPTVIVFAVFLKRIVAGMMSGAIKE